MDRSSPFLGPVLQRKSDGDYNPTKIKRYPGVMFYAGKLDGDYT